MTSFNVYEGSDSQFRVIKNGWSWPGFFFGSVWALCMQLWLVGLLLLPVEIILQMLMSATERVQQDASGSYAQTTRIIGGLVALAALSVRIIFGAFGNAWKRKRLLKNGYQLKRTLEARSKEDAISMVKGSQSHRSV
ncbi:DUF2628 domain-containing protein [Oxalicibacterium flavum]|uniref:DUF2628 domain-containing protein n=1 Tax=Oxalicibacterium flavum TaxID=179467 RepID=UPI001666B2A0|nr:DUF2628 domain-containing protein [Oxalicibacterium flavum]